MTAVPIGRRSLAVATVLMLVATALFTTIGLDGREARAENLPTPWLVTVTPSKNLTDGSKIAINLRTDPIFPIFQAKAQVCRRGVAYDVATGMVPADDFTTGGDNCPSVPISTSADLIVSDGDTLTTATQPAGETFTMYVGTGTASWESVIDQQVKTLTCDYQNPCDLVVEVRGTDVDSVTRWVPFVQPLTYMATDPIAGCGGPAEGMLATGASDRLGPTWVDLTLDQCRSGAQSGAATGASFSGEGDAMDGFSRGQLDLAYSSVGYDEAAGLGRGTASDPLTPRASAAVPIGMNAVVLAVGNGRRSATNRKVPYSDVRMTLDQVTALLAGGPFQFDAYYPEFVSLNPEFADTGLISNTSAIRVGAYADAESTSWFMTDHLKTNRPSLWKVPDTNTFGEERNLPRSATATLGLASPSFQNALDLFTGRIMLERSLRLSGADEYGGIWVLTDLATAKLLGLTVVQIENANGVFVAPDADTMTAAIPTMTTTADGRLVPNPSATPSIDGVQPYPLTYVEYAIAPVERLATAECVERATSQSLMTSWLDYLIGPGQSKLPDGIVPLDDTLRAAANSAIAMVGSTAPACATTVPLDGMPLVSPPSAIVSGYRTSTSPVVGPATGSATAAPQILADLELASALDEMGGFDSSSSSSLALLAIAGVFILVLAAAAMTTGRIPVRFRRRA